MSRNGATGRRSPIKRILNWPETILVLAVTATLMVTYPIGRDSGLFQAIEGISLDLRFQVRGPQDPTSDIVIVAIDDPTLAALGRWPFSRGLLAEAVDRISGDGAGVVVFDLLLAGPESSAVLPIQGSTESRPGAHSPEGGADLALTRAISRARNVVVPFAFVYAPSEANISKLPDAIGASAYRVVRSKTGGISSPGPHPSGILAPLASVIEAGRPAHVTVFLEPDGSLRHAHPAIRYGDAYFPGLAVETARLFLGVAPEDLVLDLGNSVSIGTKVNPTDEQTRFAIDYAGPRGTYEAISLVDVLVGDVPPGRFRDKIALIGATAAGIGDRFATPYSADLSGVEVFANVIDNILRRGFLQATSRTHLFDMLAIALAGMLTAVLGVLHRPAILASAALLLFAMWCAVNLYAFVAMQTWINFTFPGLGILLGSATVVIGRSIRDSRLSTNAERQRAALSRYVSPLAAASPHSANSAGSASGSQMAAIMFVDLVGYTAMSEMLPPDDAARILRRFHSLVERAATHCGGVVDKFIGDGALLVFGAPAGGPSDAANAVVCARRIATELADWSESAGASHQPAIACGIGIHFGPVTIAEVGGRQHAQITVAGDTVNVASRLEGLTRGFGATVIVSDTAMEFARAGGAGDALNDFGPLPAQQIRGRERPVGIWAWPAPAVG